MANCKDCKRFASCGFLMEGLRPVKCVHFRHKDDIRVVRCKDCKYCVEERDLGMYCSCWSGMMSETVADDFCSYGERKGDGDG